MDGESSCESDISESWSLIDLNLTEQLVDGQDVLNTNEPATIIEPKDVIKNEIDFKNGKNSASENFELMEFSNNANQVDDCNGVSSSTFDSPLKGTDKTGKQFQDFIFLDEDKKLSEDEKEKLNGHENVKFDCDDDLEREHKCRDTDFDTDGISVISEAECDDETRYYSNENDKNWEEELQTDYLNNAFEKNTQTVIKKRRKRVKVYSDSSDDNLNSDLVVPDRKYSDICSSKITDSSDEMQVAVNTIKKPAVYRHYRNNVANTVLSLAMGFMFAGVACIALGHFLGVHDAQQTAGEMMEALQRLRMENIQLQSRLSHLSRVFFTKENHQKPEILENVVMQHCIKAEPQITDENTKDNNGGINQEAQVDFKSLSKLKELTSKNINYNNGVEFENIVNQVHDQLAFLNNINKDHPKLKRFQELDSKIAGFIDHLFRNPPKTQNGWENVLRRFKKIHEKLNQKLCRNFEDFKNNCEVFENGKNLNLFQWFPVKEENEFPVVSMEPGMSNENIKYEFPKQEEYYEKSNENANVDDASIEDEPEPEKENKEFGQGDYKREPTPVEKIPFSDNSNLMKIETDQKLFDVNIEKKKPKEKRGKVKEEKSKFDKANKKAERRYKEKNLKENYYKEKFNKKIWKEYLKKKKFEEGKEVKKHYKKENRRKDNDKPSDKYNKNISKKNDKKEHKDYKKSEKYWKNKEFKNFKKNNISNDKIQKQISLYKGYRCGGSNCHNVSGDWVYKMAKGREQCRRHKKLSDWQFDRAKGREALRYGDEINWYFERAAAREHDRDDARWYFRRYDARNHQRKGFSPETFSWI